MINTAYERLEAKNIFICRYFSFNELLKYHAQLSMKKSFINLGPDLDPNCLTRCMMIFLKVFFVCEKDDFKKCTAKTK